MMNDYLSLLPSTFQWIAERLSSISGIPWPLWIGGLFPLYAAALSVMLWSMRGSAWPVRCLYPITSKRRPCAQWVPGEWYRCRYHNWRASYKYGHEVDTKIRRWQQADRKGNLVDRPSIGVGILRVRPAGHALLYQNGYARKSLNVLGLVPEFVMTTCRRLAAMRFRSVPDATAESSADVSDVKDNVTEGLLSVIQATRFASIIFFLALRVTGISVLLHGNFRAAAQWTATLGFVLAWAAVSSGVYYKSGDWLFGACLKNLKWWTIIFVPVGILNLVFAVVNKP
jgi:hypothetical protein